MSQTNRQVRSANRARLVIDGQTIGIAQSVSIDVSYQHQPVVRIGSPDPQEHVPGIASYRVSVGRALMLVADKLGGAQLNKNGLDALQGRTFDIVVSDDEKGGEPVETIHKCSHDSGSVRYEAGRVIMQNVTFVGIGRDSND